MSVLAAGAEELVLTGFIEQRPDGVYVDAAKLASADEFERAATRVFDAGYFFSGLDYAVFQRLLYDFDNFRCIAPVRLASEIREFTQARQALYKGIKIIGGDVYYMFEPVQLETTVDEPVYAVGEDGERRVVGSERKVLLMKASLDVDEFVADLWIKGVRFGIDIPAVRAAIQDGRCERVVVARERPPTPGRDAGIEEQTAELHRDNAPRELPNGKIDLGQFKNRFPQIGKGARLLKKTPRVLGEAGRTVAGKPIEPALPKDFDLETLAGEGTRVEMHGGCEYIVAALDGFLNLDTKTNRLSITEKIINREGVSARTTGNLSLAGDHYEEFGEVQEGRMVEGRGLTFHADVYGKVISAGGDINLLQNLVGGTAFNREGTIAVAGLVSNAVVHTERGLVRLKRAENSVVIGDRVEIEWASNCTVLAEEVDIEVSAGCAIAGKNVRIGTAVLRSGEETLISILQPDLSGINHAMEKEGKHLGECEELLAKLQQGIENLMSQPELRKYFAVAGKIRRKEIVLTPEQQRQWQQTSFKLAPTLKRITQGRDDAKVLEDEIKAGRERMAELNAEKEKAAAVLACRIDSIQGEVVARTLALPHDAPPLQQLPPRELKQRLRAPDLGGRRLLAASTGKFDWKPESRGEK